jgi:hypothetical protein
MNQSIGRLKGFGNRVARWFVFRPKIPNLLKFCRTLDWKNVDIFYGYLEYFMDIWDIL